MAELAYLASLPKKRMGTGVLFVNAEDELLIVKPTYRPEWLVPGGIVEENESPYRAAAREIQEELGLSLPIGQLLCVEYRSAEPPRSENLQFIFDGGVLSKESIAKIVLPANELVTYAFVPLHQALEKVTPYLARRLTLAMTARAQQRAIYMENGELIL